MNSSYAEQGTRASGYEELGPYHCEDCIHKTAPGEPYCIHPKVLVDPAMKDKLIRIGKRIDGSSGHPVIKGKDQLVAKIDLERGCCKYVNQSEEKK